MSDDNSPLRVLVVDDGLVNQKVLSGLLKRRHCEVIVANNGQEALDRLAAETFDLVLMDVQMPVMDGLQATKLIRQREADKGNRTPIVAVTAGADRQSCLDAGMNEYLTKPIRAERLDEVLSTSWRKTVREM